MGSSHTARFLRTLLQPHWAILLPVAISALVWLLPWASDARVGFGSKEQLMPNAVLFLVGWYGLAGATAYFGFRLGRHIRPARALDRIGYARYYLLVSCVGLAGVAYAYGSVIITNPTLLIDALNNRTFNLIRSAIPYEAGFQTLRYATILGGGFAAYRIASTRRVSPLDLLNFVALLGAAAIASRLSILLAGVVFLGLVLHGPLAREVRWWHLAAALLGLALILVPLNYVRNAGFYERFYGVSDPVLMSAYEAIAYLGAPFQASIGVANNAGPLGSGPTARTPQSVARYLLPTYFPLKFEDVIAAELRYRTYVDVQPQLTTNSALAAMYGAMGPLSFLVAPLILFLSGIAAGHFLGYRTAVFLVSYVIVYCFAEFWRVFVFNFGIIHFLVLCLVGPPSVLVVGRAIADARTNPSVLRSNGSG